MSVHKKAATSKGRRNSSVNNSRGKLHPREVMLIRHLRVMGKSDYQIWKEYRIAIPAIRKAKKEIERQAAEEFENKEMYAVDLAKLKDPLEIIVGSMGQLPSTRTCHRPIE